MALGAAAISSIDIALGNGKWTTDRGIAAGASANQIVAAYGKPRRRTRHGAETSLAYPRMTFELKRDKLVALTLTSA